jgi:uncharacterized membrane protein YgcG
MGLWAWLRSKFKRKRKPERDVLSEPSQVDRDSEAAWRERQQSYVEQDQERMRKRKRPPPPAPIPSRTTQPSNNARYEDDDSILGTALSFGDMLSHDSGFSSGSDTSCDTSGSSEDDFSGGGGDFGGGGASGSWDD